MERSIGRLPHHKQKDRWYLKKLQKHKKLKDLQETDVDQQERENNLENLLGKVNNCPDVCIVQNEMTTLISARLIFMVTGADYSITIYVVIDFKSTS